MSSFSEHSHQRCPEYSALVDMTEDFCKALPINELIPGLITSRVLDISGDIEDLRNAGRTEADSVERFILKHLYPDLELRETSHFSKFIEVMKRSSKCEFLVKRLEEHIRHHRQFPQESTPGQYRRTPYTPVRKGIFEGNSFRGFRGFHLIHEI